MNSCAKDRRIGLVVTTVDDSTGKFITGAKVHVHCDTVANKGCVVDKVLYSDRFGNASFNFELEALLIIEVTKDSLYGKSWAELVAGENVSVTVKLL